MKSRMWLLTMPLLLTVSSMAYAGTKATAPVQIDTQNGIIQGSFGSARNSEDNTQALVVEHQISANGVQSMRLFARTESGTTAICFTQDLSLIDVLEQAFNTDGHVNVLYSTTTGRCLAAIIRNGSLYEPKQ